MQIDTAPLSTGQPAELDIRIDPEFRSLVPPQGADELRGLEAGLQAEGNRDPVVVWKGHGILLDGHHRVEICLRLGIPLKPPVEIDRPSRDHAVLWIRENQLNRRNLTDDQRAIIADEVRELRSALRMQEQRKGAAEKRWRPERYESDNVSEPDNPPTDTRAEIARDYKLPERKLRYTAEVRKKRPDLAQKVRAGEMTLAQARRAIQHEATMAKHASIEAREVMEMAGTFNVMVIDPPWPQRGFGGALLDYPVMPLEEIKREVGARLARHAHDDCHVFLWTTQKFLPVAFELLGAWGLRYGFTITWHKTGGMKPLGFPQYNSEFAVYGRKGSPVFTDTKAFSTCFEAPRGVHSEKPEEFYEMLRRCTEGMRRFDMYNRREIEGFEGWGYEAPEKVSA